MVRCIRSCSVCGLRFVSHGGTGPGRTNSCPGCRSTRPGDGTGSVPAAPGAASGSSSAGGDSGVAAEALGAAASGGESLPGSSSHKHKHNSNKVVGCEPIRSSDPDRELCSNAGSVCTTVAEGLPSEPPLAAVPMASPRPTKPSGGEDRQEQQQQQQQPQQKPPPPPPPNGDVCFICGISLAHLKRRIDHIKRCSKKHGITGRDVVVPLPPPGGAGPRDGERDGGTPGAPPQEPPSATFGGPGTTDGGDAQWHGGAGTLVDLAAGKPPAPGAELLKAAAGNHGGIRPPVPLATRNLNNVLMAGSRRLGVAAGVHRHKHGAAPAEPDRSRKRGRPGSAGAHRAGWNCPLYKKITGTDFVVDGFHYAKRTLTKNYFLSHFHSDHYGGIASSWDAGTIYCSLPTASLVHQQLGVDKKHLHPLPMNTPTVIESRGRAVTVTLLDANHCPGAVMFFFEVGRRTILHVGDFRWSRDAMLGDPSSPLGSIASQKRALDELYLDTTYCDEKYHLPEQSVAIKATIEAFETETAKKGRTLHLFGAYTIGKEKIWASVALRFGRRVCVDRSRHRVLSALDLPEEITSLLTTNKEESNLWVVPMGHLNMKKLPDYLGAANSKPFSPHYDRIVGYRPTGWSLSSKPGGSVLTSRTSKDRRLTIHSVPYSEHSSFPELVDCLACLRPEKIVPTVKASASGEQVKLLMGGLRQRQRTSKLFFGKAV